MSTIYCVDFDILMCSLVLGLVGGKVLWWVGSHPSIHVGRKERRKEEPTPHPTTNQKLSFIAIASRSLAFRCGLTIRSS